VTESTPLRLLLLSAHFGVGGAERHTLELGTRLSKERFSVFLAHIKPVATLLSTPQFSRCETFCCNGARWFDVAAARRLAGFIERNQIESVLCSNFYPAMIASMARQFSRKKFRISVVYHSTVLPTLKERLQMRLYVALRCQYDLVVFICENQRRHWIASGYPRARSEATIHNGIDVDAFSLGSIAQESASNCRTQAGFNAADYVVGICAALRPEKGHLDLLKAIAQLRRNQPNAKLMIIGDGPERGRVGSAIAEAGLTRQVFISGYQQDVRPWIASCDVMVLASTAIETFSLAALESMALERPVVMTNIGGASEQVFPGINGFLFAPSDIDQLADYLGQLANPELRTKLGQAARAKVVECFDVGRMIERYERELSTVIPGNPPILGGSEK
jgi:glycosyltransferase involved in cell wall biosynthesis